MSHFGKGNSSAPPFEAAPHKSRIKKRAKQRFIPTLERLETRTCPVTLTVGSNLNISQLRDAQIEGPIAIDPTNPQHIFAASESFHAGIGWVNYTPGIYAAFSTTGGGAGSWTGYALGTGSETDSLPNAVSDPRAAFDSFGNLYLTYVTISVMNAGTSTGTGDTTTTLCDSHKNWVPGGSGVGEWANNMKVFIDAGTDAGQSSSIVSNTATCLTVSPAFTAPPDSTSHFVIRTVQEQTNTLVIARSTDGGQNFSWLDFVDNGSTGAGIGKHFIATGPGLGTILLTGTSTGSNSATTLNDTGRSWTTNQWAGDLLVITGGTGLGQANTILSNTATQLTVAQAWTKIPDTSTYEIATKVGSIWVMWGNHVRGAPATALGATGNFISTETAAGGGLAMTGMAVGPSGQVLVSSQDALHSGQPPPPANIYTSLDPDGLGTTFGFQSAIQVATTYVATPGGDQLPASIDNKPNAAATLAWDDRSAGTNHGRVYLVYTNAPTIVDSTHYDTNIFESYSDNAWAPATPTTPTWSSTKQVNDDSSGKSQFWPAAVVDQTTGYLAATWYDGRNDTGHVMAQIYGTVSADGGSTFAANVKIGAALSNGLHGNFHETGKATSATSTTLTDAHDSTTQNWAINWWANPTTGYSQVRIISGTGADSGTIYTITNQNYNNTFTVSPGWQHGIPDITSQYQMSPLYLDDFGDYTGLDYTSGKFFAAWADNSNSTSDNPDGPDKAMDVYIAQVTVTAAPSPRSAVTGSATGVATTAAALSGGMPPAFTASEAVARLMSVFPVVDRTWTSAIQPSPIPTRQSLMASEAALLSKAVDQLFALTNPDGQPSLLATPKDKRGGGLESWSLKLAWEEEIAGDLASP